MKITFVGRATHESEIKKVGESEITEVIFKKKYYDHNTGEEKNCDYFPVQIWKEKIEYYKNAIAKNELMEVSGYLNGKTYEGEKGIKYFLTITGTSFTPVKK